MRQLNAVIAHKSFECASFDSNYTIYTPRKITTNCKHVKRFKSELDDRLWSEWSALYYIAKHESFDTISVNHYRRKITLLHDKITFAAPMYFNCTVAQQYAKCHNFNDLQLCANIVAQLYPTMSQSFVETCNNKMLIPYNCVILTRALFIEWVNFIVEVCKKVLESLHIESYNDAIRYVSHVENAIYQARIVSFLSERLTTAYALQYMKTKMPMYYSEVQLLEKGQLI